MANPLDMSLEELIQNNKQQHFKGTGAARGGRRGGRGRGRGDSLRINRPSSYTVAKSFSRAKDAIWQRDMFEDSIVPLGIPAGPDAGTKLYIWNLDLGVTDSDIKEIFSEVGDLKRCAVHYDRTGRSNGTAEVVYINKSNAAAAVKRYNNVQLDGKPMKIELIGSNLGTPMSTCVNFTGAYTGRGRTTVVRTPGFTRATAVASEKRRINGWNQGRGYGSRQFRGRGRVGGGRGRGRASEKSAVELDKELENYHTEAMQTS